MTKKEEYILQKRIQDLEEKLLHMEGENQRLKDSFSKCHDSYKRSYIFRWSYNDVDQRIIFDESFCKITGYAEINLQSESKGVFEKDLKTFIHRLLDENISEYEKECRLIKDKNMRYFLFRGISNNAKGLSELTGTIIELFSSSFISKKISNGDIKFQTLFNNANLGVGFFELFYDIKGGPTDLKVIDINQAGARAFNQTAEVISGKWLRDFLPIVENFWLDKINKFIEQGQSGSFDSFSEVLNKFLRVSIFPVFDHVFVLLIEDQTKTTNASYEFIKYKNYFDRVLDNLPVAVFAKNIDNNKHTFWNKAFEKITDIKAEEGIGKTDTEIFGEQKGGFFQYMDSDILKTNQRVDYETTYTTSNGDQKFLKIAKLPVEISRNQKTIIGIVEDITDIRNIKNELDNSESYLELAEQMASLARWEYRFNSKKIYYSPQFKIIHNTEIDITIDQYQKFIQEDDLIKIHDLIRESIDQERSTFEIIYRFKTENQGVKHLYSKAHIIRGRNNRPVKILGTVQDVTGVQNIETAIVNSEGRFQTIFNKAPFGMAILDTDGNSISFNNVMRNLFLIPEEKNNFNIFEITHEVDEIQIKQKFSEIFSGSINSFKYKSRFKIYDNSIVWASVTVSAFQSEKSMNALVILDDITDIVVSEVNLRESEQRLRNILDAIPDKIYRLSAQYEITDYYPGEYSDPFEETNTGKNFLGLFEKSIAAEFEKRLKQVIRLGVYSVYTYACNLEGALRFFEARIIKSGSQELIVIIRDNTKNKISERALSDSEEKYRTLTENIQDFILRFDTQGKYLFLNRVACQSLGINKEQVIGKPWYKASFSQRFSEHWGELIGHVVTTQKPFKILLDWKSGQVTRSIEWQINPEYDKSGAVISVLSFGRDITDIKNTEKELIRAKLRAEESDVLKTAFLANMSHEIRTPMNAIMGFSELLKRSDIAPNNVQDYISIISQNSKQLLGIINDVLDISRIESGQVIMNYSYFDLNKLLDELFISFEGKLKEKQIKAVLKKARISPIVLYSDEGKIRQIISNLFDNSVKFTFEGLIEVVYEIIDGNVCIKVKDTGIGIPEEKQEIIFDSFRQADDSFTRQYGGTGLGLSIAKNFVQLLGGEIWVEANMEKGSKFIFSIPIKTEEEFETSENAIDKKYYWKHRNIIFVERDENKYNELKQLLEQYGPKVIHFKTGIEVINYVKENGIVDMIILNACLSDMNGLNVADEIVQFNSSIPVIIQSQNGYPDVKEAAYKAGCVEYLPYNIEPEILLKKIDIYLSVR